MTPANQNTMATGPRCRIVPMSDQVVCLVCPAVCDAGDEREAPCDLPAEPPLRTLVLAAGAGARIGAGFGFIVGLAVGVAFGGGW